ncbi:MAG: hypothetical protein H6730_07680 [Deltaproteobacteria bacterium]|nr:hypothetical protein [Deltaproteobacteria bacterium]
MALPLLLAGGAAVYTGFKMLGKLFGSDPDFTQAWMMNRMTGRGGFLKTFFQDGLGKLFMGSRTASAMYSSGMMMGMPFAASLYGSPFMAGNAYMANPYMMGTMPYAPMAMGRTMWGC